VPDDWPARLKGSVIRTQNRVRISDWITDHGRLMFGPDQCVIE